MMPRRGTSNLRKMRKWKVAEVPKRRGERNLELKIIGASLVKDHTVPYKGDSCETGKEMWNSMVNVCRA